MTMPLWTKGVERGRLDRHFHVHPAWRSASAYIELEDSPRPVTWQLDLLRRVGFGQVELLHKNSCFAAFGAVKSAASPG
jgi:hypothetical protein